MTRDRPIMVCASCGRVLDYYEASEPHLASYWRHTYQDMTSEDHAAVPVQATSENTKIRCDFCNVDILDGKEWTIPAKTFQMSKKIGPFPAQMSDSDWAACADCAVLITDDRWEDLINRVTRGSSSVFDKNILRPMYAALRANITGKPYRVEKP